ncbi:MAG TPA: hypothetical protein VER03_21230 [Bryobacteraceae bacterium]|nr:hypothetical protein [Bryobacteraceae bacterium]
MKQHLEDDDLILHFYGETGSAAEPHLASCGDCRAQYQALQRVLNSVESNPIPHRGEEYGDQIWQRIEPKLGRRGWWTSWLRPARWVPGVAAAALLVLAFFAGRYSPREQAPVVAREDGGSEVRERVLVVAVGDHLERSKMLLVELANADPNQKIDWFDQREVAEDLVYTNRLYRQTAMTAGAGRVAGLLEELERVLIEIAHSPEELQGVRLRNLRERIRNEGLIFKIRVAGSKLAQGETL